VKEPVTNHRFKGGRKCREWLAWSWGGEINLFSPASAHFKHKKRGFWIPLPEKKKKLGTLQTSRQGPTGDPFKRASEVLGGRGTCNKKIPNAKGKKKVYFHGWSWDDEIQ